LFYAESGSFEVAPAAARLSVAALRADGCPIGVSAEGLFALRPCFALEGGVLRGQGQKRGPITTTQTTQDLWLAMGFLARAQGTFGDVFFAEVQAGPWFPLMRREFRFRDPDVLIHDAELERFTRLVESHFDFIWRLLRRLGVPSAEADDAAQEVFLVASRRLSVIREGSERAFLFGTALRVATKVSQRRRRLNELDSVAAQEPSAPPAAPDELVERRRARELLDAILEAMSEELRLVFVLFELEELTIVEIAALLEIPQGTAASRLRRARGEFQARVERAKARLRSRAGRST
jgi:RNA polymerase sigma-70 factor (ECF subfamily)